MDIELNNDQTFCCYQLEDWWKNQDKQVFNIAGAAGTGKSTRIRHFIKKIGLTNDEVLFVAFMGKAVSRMIETGLPARTIHSTCYDYKKKIVLDENGNRVLDEYGKPIRKWVGIRKEDLDDDIQLIVVDEAYTVDQKLAIDLLSFGIPIVALGDRHQLPPPFGVPFFLSTIDFELTEIMRQEEDDPIVEIAQDILNDRPLVPGIYGRSAIIRRREFNVGTLKYADVILTMSNAFRGEINSFFRTEFLGISGNDLNLPKLGEKLICRRNNWTKKVKLGKSDMYLTNGTSGVVEYIDKYGYDKSYINIDFQPDFDTKPFRNLRVDLKRLNAPIGTMNNDMLPRGSNAFEYGYALTVHSAQGSEWDKVIFLDEKGAFRSDPLTRKKILYTAVTRAKESITIVLDE